MLKPTKINHFTGKKILRKSDDSRNHNVSINTVEIIDARLGSSLIQPLHWLTHRSNSKQLDTSLDGSSLTIH